MSFSNWSQYSNASLLTLNQLMRLPGTFFGHLELLRVLELVFIIV